ncbi:LADA_0F05534g1_1 [Lachancea dasiensis]|uniref:25S rRNA adenine-N(1) methyltransferase n=1 Tax=Lachancea dasiensis TaxID=1072105 RepID=A0A1G4JJG9_9SACH|nr:LADA_0F05534g1_1 [Lachancea dasiensis]
MLSKRKKTVTGSLVLQRQPKIKPAKARQIIRRFHVLINKRRIICGVLKLALTENDEQRSASFINKELKEKGLETYYKQGWNAPHPDSELEKKMLQSQKIREDKELARALGYIMCEIHERGGLQNYQLASTIGQDKNRGGDSSKTLVAWFRAIREPGRRYRALEIGSLSAKNAISTSGIFDPVVRIDLNSNDPEHIQRQDFMDMSLPEKDSERFDLISCSLVLNFVPTPKLRGEMLKRFKSFLRREVNSAYIFLVLPLPCILNSRYMDEERLFDIMSYLGYERTHSHQSHKIIYLLFKTRSDVHKGVPLEADFNDRGKSIPIEYGKKKSSRTNLV